MSELVSSIIGTAITLGIVFLAIAYVVTLIKKGSGDASDKVNATLRELLDAQDKKINELERHVATLSGRVEELSRKNGDLQEIIEKALNEYFLAHPEAVIKLTEIKGMRKNDYGQ